MQVIKARNVNAAYMQGLSLLRSDGVRQGSRAGEVLVMPTPVTTVYERPTERVLFEPNRDANPFFHLGEALWMLAGRNDARWLDRFVSDFSTRFAEEDGLQHGAYGYRWRQHFDVEGGGDIHAPDQLDTIIGLLKRNPEDRRIVLTMWDPVADLNTARKDIPCNTHAYLRLRPAELDLPGMEEKKAWRALDLTVCCRSNDAVWGAYGANAVHFSILQEYLAARLGAAVGTYYQISNNFHVYTEVLNKVWPVRAAIWEDLNYTENKVKPFPLVSDPESFDVELDRFLDELNVTLGEHGVFGSYKNAFFPEVAGPFFQAHKCWKAKEYSSAYSWLEHMPENNDWRLAAEEWFDRRQAKRMSRDD